MTREVAELTQFKIKAKRKEAELLSKAEKEVRKHQRLADENKLLQA